MTANLLASELLLEKSTPKLQKIVSMVSSETPLNIWLTLDVSQLEKVEVKLSDAALRRRKKVDPVNFLINAKDSTFAYAVLDEIRNSGAEIRHVLYWFDAVTVEITPEKLTTLASLSFVKEIDIVQKLKSDRSFQYEPLKSSKKSSSKSLSLPYGFSQFQNRYIKTEKLHAAGLSGRGIRIAMFDSGFNTLHRAFDSLNIIATFNFIDNIIDVTQPDCETGTVQSSHGTTTLGVVGGYVQDTLIGAAYNAEFLLAKTEITCGGVEIVQEEDNWIAAAQWADQQGADIISSSLGYITFQDTVNGFYGYTFSDLDGDTPRITAAADIAALKNILVINSAGNERGNSWNHIVTPCDGNFVIAVGATTPDSSLAGFSSPGPTADGRIKPDIATLGTSVVSAHYAGGFTTTASGTSFSAPLVTSGAALALEHDSTLTAAELRDLIRASGDKADNPDNDFGYGLFDATKAADIVSIVRPYAYLLNRLGLNRILIETAGRANNVPILSVIGTPNGISLSDNNDGTGYLDVVLTNNSASVQTVRLTADVGYFVDTVEITILSPELLDEQLVVGPNPCADFLNIYFYEPDNFESLAIYNISGEKVWEVVNNASLNADINRIEERWNCTNLSGELVADGAYIVVVTAGGKQFYRKVLKIDK